MKKLSLLLVLVSLNNLLFAQNEALNWYFGNNAGLTFSTTPPSILPGGQLNTAEGCASISDSSGNLLFYSDGETIYCSNHTVMPNGTGLLGDWSSTQSCIILPDPGNSGTYYVVTAPVYSSNNPVAYTLVNMPLNGGLGGIVFKNDTLLASSTEKLTAVSHQNGIDIWIIVHEFPGSNFYAFLLTAAGINPIPVISSVGTALTTGGQKGGYLKVSPCGNKVANVIYGPTVSSSTIELFDFDNSSGIISNPVQLGFFSAIQSTYGIEFSPDNSRLYTSVAQPGTIIQFNLLAGSNAAIIASRDTIGSSNSNLFGMQLGIDGKIYVAKIGNDSLACISDPNLIGIACGYIDNYVSVGASQVCLIGLPNYITSLFCNIPSGIYSDKTKELFTIYPNPFNSGFSIKIEKQHFNKATITIQDILGQTVFFKHENNLNNNYSKAIDLSFLSKGMYLLEVNIDGERTVKKFVKE